MNLQNSGAACREKAVTYPPVMPAQAGIQYSETPATESGTRSVLDTRLRGYDGGGVEQAHQPHCEPTGPSLGWRFRPAVARMMGISRGWRT
jgi:hypothetical protein